MELKNYTNNNHIDQPDRREGCSLPKGVNFKQPSRTFNRRLKKIHARTKSDFLVYKEIVEYQWKYNFQPQWFITLLWNDLPTRYEAASSHSRDFRNKFLVEATGKKLKKLPKHPDRPALIFFHERKPVINNGKQILVFHTHLHLGLLPDEQNHLWYVDYLISNKVKPRSCKLLKSTSSGNEGVVIKPWNSSHHAGYNLKDYLRYKHDQDSDLTLDYNASDLLFP